MCYLGDLGPISMRAASACWQKDIASILVGSGWGGDGRGGRQFYKLGYVTSVV